MKKSGAFPSILVKVLLIVLAAILLCYCMVMVVFSSLGLSAFIEMEKSTMEKHARYIATLTSSYFEKRMTDDRYLYLLGSDNNIWSGSVYVFNADGDLIVRSDGAQVEKEIKLAKKYLSSVLQGNSIAASEGIIIGIPVQSSLGNTVGAVFIVKQASEIKAALGNIKEVLQMAFIMSFLVMLMPVFIIVSYTIARPIRNMTDAAESMAAGNYNTTADIRGHGELAVLGRSLNELSRSLTSTIGDLQSEQNLLHEILNGMEDGVIAFDLDKSLVQHNPAAARLMGGGTQIPYDNEVMLTIMDHAQTLSPSNTSTEFSTNSGERILHIRMNLLGSTKKDGIILALLHDATESSRYEQSRKDYVANVSHELRTPIANIKGISEALCDGIISEDNLQKYYTHLYKESDRLSRLINDLLELSRMQSGKLSMSKRKTNLYGLIMDVADRFSRAAEEQGKELITECPESIGNVYTNEDRIEQVLVVLIDNAIKHSESEYVTISAQEISATKITVSVINKGEIAKDDIPHLFERFFKADKAHSGEGSGLGLSIASEIMTLLDEKLWVTSENGVVNFSFTLTKYREQSSSENSNY